MKEIELKLQLDAVSAEVLGASNVLPEQWRAVQQRDLYFDTADCALAEAGLSLRIRQSGSHRTQTIKRSGSSAAGLFARSEWEMPVTNDVPFVDDTSPVHTLLGGAVEDLLRVFEVEVSRRIWDVQDGCSNIEVALDRGTISAGDRHTSICEMEMELKSGQPQALFDFARKLDGAAQVRLGVLTKPERGNLLRQAQRRVVKAVPVPLEDEMTAVEAFQIIVQACVKQFRLNENLLLASRSPEPLHQARVALRRLRSAFSIFKPLIDTQSARELREGIRDLAGVLGQARDLDVLLQRAKPGPLRDRLKTEREAAYDRVEEELGSEKARALLLSLVEWVHSCSLLVNLDTEETRSMPVRTFAGRALSRFRRKVKEGGRNMRHMDDEARHELRKDAKKLRYAADFFARLFDGKRGKAHEQNFIVALEAVQEELGALNDLATVPHILDRLGVADDPEAPALLAGGTKKALIAAAADAHDNLIDARRYWR